MSNYDDWRQACQAKRSMFPAFLILRPTYYSRLGYQMEAISTYPGILRACVGRSENVWNLGLPTLGQAFI
jgi:hypothetical protein